MMNNAIKYPRQIEKKEFSPAMELLIEIGGAAVLFAVIYFLLLVGLSMVEEGVLL